MSSLEDRLEQLDQAALGDNVQIDTVIKCISEPLKWLSYENDSSHGSFQQLELVQHVVWKRHVWNVVKEILPRWTFILSSTKYRHLIDSTLCIKEHLDSNISFHMVKVSLPIVIESLSIEEQHSFDTLTLYSSLLNLLSLDKHIFKLYSKYTTKNDVLFFCNLICSIPGHLSNVFGIQLDKVMFSSQHEWYIDRNFYAKLSKRIAEYADTTTLLFTQELVSKVIRQGYEDILVKSVYQMSFKGIWSSVIKPCFDQITKALLYHIKQDILPNSTITRVSKELSNILFDSTTTCLYYDEFLNIALLRLSKSSWVDDSLCRLSICTIIHAQGFKDRKLSNKSMELIIKYTKRVIGTWSDPTFIKHGTYRERKYVTMSILSLVAYLPKEMIETEIISQTPLLPSITSYFDSGDKAVAQLGAVVAESISSLTGNPIETGLLDNNHELKSMKELVNTKDIFLEEDDLIVQPENTQEESENEQELEEELDPDSIYCPEDEDEESADEFQAYQMEEESDDEGMKKEETSKKETKKPVFIRDLIRYLKDKEDPLKLEIGLNSAEQVIRQKTGAGLELSESAVELARNLIGIPETFEIENFRKLQQDSLIALIVGVPETVTGFIIDELYDRNTSTGQKQLILAAISLAVRELSGWSIQQQDEIQETTTGKELELLKTGKIGTTLFLSKRMEIEKRQKTSKNRLSGLAGTVFFFPLLVGWWEGAQGRIKYWIGSNKLLSERFIMTLNIILHSSTNIPDKRRIVKEYFEFVSSMKYAESSDIKKALLLGLDTIVNTCYKGQEGLLLQNYTRELSETKDWLEELMENSNGMQVNIQQIIMGILVKISQIALTTNS